LGTDTFGCTDTACIQIAINKLCGMPFLPDAFTPNSDHTDDIFKVLGNCIATIHLKIFDRWGLLLFESSNQAEVWDGIYQGKASPQYVYVWTLQATDLFGRSYNMKGDVTLIR
jgi:gliding motility-associated-like protein